MNLLIFNIIMIFIEAFILKLIGNKNHSIIFLYIAFIQLTLLHSLVDPNSLTDLPAYVQVYQTVPNYDLIESFMFANIGYKMEPGWVFLNRILSYFSKDTVFLLFVSSIIIIGSYINSIKRYSLIPWLSVFLYLCGNFNQSLFVLRQHMAISICLCSIPFVIERKPYHFLLFILLASSIHLSALIFIPIYYIYGLKINKNYLFYITIFCIFGSIFVNPIYNWLFSIEWYSSSSEEEGSNYTAFFISLFVCLFYLNSIKFRVMDIKNDEKLFFIMASIWLILQATGAGFAPTNRLAKYFSTSEIWLIPYALARTKNRSNQFIYSTIILLAYSFLFVSNCTYVKGLQFIRI